MHDLVVDRPGKDDDAVTPRGELGDQVVGVAASMGGEDQHRPFELGGHGLVAEHDLGEVGTGQVGEDDAVGGVPALGELAAQLAGHVLELGGGLGDPRPGLGRDAVGVAQGPRDGRDRDTRAVCHVPDRGRHAVSPPLAG